MHESAFCWVFSFYFLELSELEDASQNGGYDPCPDKWSFWICYLRLRPCLIMLLSSACKLWQKNKLLPKLGHHFPNKFPMFLPLVSFPSSSSCTKLLAPKFCSPMSLSQEATMAIYCSLKEFEEPCKIYPPNNVLSHPDCQTIRNVTIRASFLLV